MQLLIVFASFLSTSYVTNQSTKFIVSQTKIISTTSLPSYDSMKIIISKQRQALYASKEQRNYDLLERRFVSIIVDSIFPYWYGTSWDFNGTTQAPGKGSIACGYFVSTILSDAGIPLNRVKLGQSASQVFIKTFANKKGTKIFSDKPLDSTLNFIKSKGIGLFIIGLDFHVGFIYNDGKNIWFIHSKWSNPKAVVKENAAESGILYYSKYRIVGKISNNKMLLDSWVK